MKKFVFWSLTGVSIASGLMVGVHWLEIRSVESRLSAINRLTEKQRVAEGIILEMEQFRRLASNFKKLSSAEVSSAKSNLKSSIADGVAKLDRLGPTEDDRARMTRVQNQLSELLVNGAKLESNIWVRDIYAKPEVREPHERITAALREIQQSAMREQAQIQPDLKDSAHRSFLVLSAIASVILLFTALVLIREYWVYRRPMRKLLRSIHDLSQGSAHHNPTRPQLKGPFQAIEEKLYQLSSSVEAMRKERHHFLTAVASELRSPLVALRTGAETLVSENERLNPAQRAQAAEVVRSSMFRLSKSLDDLTDIVDLERKDLSMEEKVEDLGELLQRTARSLSGPHSTHPIQVVVPSQPLWALIDSRRIERVLIHLVNKITLQSPQGGPIQISVTRISQPQFRGLEIQLHRSEHDGPAHATGPNQELLKHWVAENGFGMKLSDRIVRAHGGQVLAAGLVGTGIHFTLRLPEERIATSTSSSSVGDRLARPLEGFRIQTMLPEQVINFGS